MNDMYQVVKLFGLFGNHQAGSIYDKNGICPTLDTMGGGYRQPLVVISGNIKEYIGGYNEQTKYLDK